jgi:hypothetical protein
MSAQAEGRLFERVFARLFGSKPQRGSGSNWFAKQDVADGHVLWSLKLSRRDRIRFGPYDMGGLMKEVEISIHGKGGVGGSILPGVAIHDAEGNTFCVLRAEDMTALLSDGTVYITPSKDEQRRNRISKPVLMRDAAE